MDSTARFLAAFESRARVVRRRRALRAALSGAALGLALGVALAFAFWALRLGEFRPWSALLALAGASAGLLLSRQRAFTDAEIALYLDACLSSREAITSALAMAKLEGDIPAREEVLRRGLLALESGDPELAKPRWLSRLHYPLPLLAVAIGYLAWIPLPEVAPSPLPPGSSLLRLTTVEGLDEIEALGRFDAHDPAEKARLEELAEEAKRLREKLGEGIERRAAQAEIAKLRDAISAEKLSLGDGDRRAGFEAAIGRLAQEGPLKDAAKALGDRDLQGFDEALEKLANQREKRDRRAAERALEEAEELARKAGASDVAQALADAKERMKRQEARAEMMRELAEALGDSVKGELDDFDASEDPESAERLAEALGRALEQLSGEERQRLSERLSRELADETLAPSTQEGLREYAKQLSSPEGARALADELRRLANEDPLSEGARKQQALEDAEQGAAQAEGQISGRPLPLPMAGNGSAAAPGQGSHQGSGDGSKGAPSGGSGEDGSRGEHAGRTDAIDGESLPSRATGRIDKNMPMPGVAMGRAPGRPGETAKVLGTGALPSVGPKEISGVERSEVPEEYREQVGRYFQP